MEPEAIRLSVSTRPLTGEEGRRPEGVYEGFLELPVPVVLGVLWLVGVVLTASVAGVLYLLGTLLLTLVEAEFPR